MAIWISYHRLPSLAITAENAPPPDDSLSFSWSLKRLSGFMHSAEFGKNRSVCLSVCLSVCPLAIAHTLFRHFLCTGREGSERTAQVVRFSRAAPLRRNSFPQEDSTRTCECAIEPVRRDLLARTRKRREGQRIMRRKRRQKVVKFNEDRRTMADIHSPVGRKARPHVCLFGVFSS